MASPNKNKFDTLIPLLPPRPLFSLASFKTWGTMELIVYLNEQYHQFIDEFVFHVLRRYRITGPWFLYLRETDYINWKFTAEEAWLLYREARLIEDGDRVNEKEGLIENKGEKVMGRMWWDRKIAKKHGNTAEGVNKGVLELSKSVIGGEMQSLASKNRSDDSKEFDLKTVFTQPK